MRPSVFPETHDICARKREVSTGMRGKRCIKMPKVQKQRPFRCFPSPFLAFYAIFGYDQYSAMDGGGEKAPGEVPVGENVNTYKFEMCSLAVLPENAGEQNPAGRF